MYVDRLFIVLFICLFFLSHLIQLYRIDKKKPKHKLTKHPNRHAKQQQPQQQLIPTNQSETTTADFAIRVFDFLNL